MTDTKNGEWRKTTQELIPQFYKPVPEGQYDLYPGFPIGKHKINTGFTALSEIICSYETIIIDGYVGIFWEQFRDKLGAELIRGGLNAQWISSIDFMRPQHEIDEMLIPCLGGDDPIFGTRYKGSLSDFFDLNLISKFQKRDEELTIVYGPGASLIHSEPGALILYLDLPKNEIQFRSRAGTIL